MALLRSHSGRLLAFPQGVFSFTRRNPTFVTWATASLSRTAGGLSRAATGAAGPACDTAWSRCAPLAALSSSVGHATSGTVEAGVTHDDVSEYYGKVIQKQSDLATSACLVKTAAGTDIKKLLGNIHNEILDKFYGCGSPIPPLLEGCTVLDLGCGTGRDAYVAAQLVGESGRVIGVDMTDEQLEVARRHEEWQRERFGYAKANTSFQKGLIEDLKAANVEDSSVDVVMSNCVVNLAPDKAPVLREIARVLKPGGELYFSDVFADRRVPEHLRKDKVLYGECLSGALYIEDFRRLMAAVGFGGTSWGIVEAHRITVGGRIGRAIGDIGFYSITMRGIKMVSAAASADDAAEDFGQLATYAGTIPGAAHAFVLDDARVFQTGEPTPVDATTAAMLSQSRYTKAFNVTEPGPHVGVFRGWQRPIASIAGQSRLWRYSAGVDSDAACCT